MRELVRIVVNGKVIKESKFNIKNWKLGYGCEIAPLLIKGDNEIVIEVNNPDGPAVLLVKSSLLGSTQCSFNSNTDWEVTQASYPDRWVKAGLASSYESSPRIYKTPPFFTHPSSKILFAFYLLFILLTLNPRRFFHKNQTIPPLVLQNNQKVITIFCVFILFIALILNIHNTIICPYNSLFGFDGRAHVGYIRYVASKWQVPLPHEGWQMYQPPLYYFVAAIIYRLVGTSNGLEVVQFMSMLIGIGNLCFSWLILRELFKKDPLIQLLGLSVAAFLPMCIYMNPHIGNEVFTGSLISLATYLIIKYGFKAQIKIQHIFLIGIVVGLALLSKYTAFFIFVSITLVLMMRLIKKKYEIRNLIIFLVIVFAVSGWLYIRNTVKFNDPFIGNWDKESGFYGIGGAPGYRTLSFYLKFSTVFFNPIPYSKWASFWDGMYGSMWGDSHESFLRFTREGVKIGSSIVIWLALLPTVAILLGFCQSFKSVFKSPQNNPYFVLIMTSLLTILSLILFTIEVPFASTIKAFFYISLLPSISVFAGKGLYTMCKNLKKFRFVIYLHIVALYCFIVILFWKT
jgi:hypothetical protein